MISSVRAGNERERELSLLSVDEVAEVLRTSRKAIYMMFERGQLPRPVRIGRRLLLVERDLVEWVEQKRAVSSRENGR